MNELFSNQTKSPILFTNIFERCDDENEKAKKKKVERKKERRVWGKVKKETFRTLKKMKKYVELIADLECGIN